MKITRRQLRQVINELLNENLDSIEVPDDGRYDKEDIGANTIANYVRSVDERVEALEDTVEKLERHMFFIARELGAPLENL